MPDEREWWNKIYATGDEMSSSPDEVLRSQIKGLSPGRALDIGCGAGTNAVWLAQQGWQVTAVDFSEAATERGRRLAAEKGVEVDFTVADATTYLPQGLYDLIVSFYIQLFPTQRAKMLATAAATLAPGGTLLFAGHDRSGPPPGWEEEYLLTLTTPEEVVAELQGLKIEKAHVFDYDPDGPHGSHAGVDDEHGQPNGSGAEDEHEAKNWLTTVVRAVKLV